MPRRVRVAKAAQADESGLAKETETASSRHVASAMSTGMRNRAVCSQISSIAETPRAGMRTSWQGRRKPRFQPTATSDPPGRSSTVEIGSRRGRREQGAVPDWKTGVIQTPSRRADEKSSLHREVPLAKARSTTGPRKCGRPRSRTTPRVTSDRQVQGPGQASRDTRASTHGSRLEPRSRRAARSESKGAREKSMGSTGADRHLSFADCME